MLEEDKAIVTDIEGTTRDIVEGKINIGGFILNMIDTAGIRKTEDIVEKIGVNKSLELIENSDLILYVLNNNEELKQEDLELIKKLENKNYIVIIHSRDASFDTLEIIKQNSDVNYTMHCYSYSLETANILLQYNVMFGIGGVVTFKNSKELKKVVENIPINNILLETDSPYLTPEPYRGEKNEPKNVLLVAEKIAELKNISKEEVLKITTKNAIERYNIKR